MITHNLSLSSQYRHVSSKTSTYWQIMFVFADTFAYKTVKLLSSVRIRRCDIFLIFFRSWCVSKQAIFPDLADTYRYRLLNIIYLATLTYPLKDNVDFSKYVKCENNIEYITTNLPSLTSIMPRVFLSATTFCIFDESIHIFNKHMHELIDLWI
jgi:hypothetical protein